MLPAHTGLPKKQQSYNFLLLILCYLTIATILYIFNSLFVLGSSSVKYTNNEKSNMPSVHIHSIIRDPPSPPSLISGTNERTEADIRTLRPACLVCARVECMTLACVTLAGGAAPVPGVRPNNRPNLALYRGAAAVAAESHFARTSENCGGRNARSCIQQCTMNG